MDVWNDEFYSILNIGNEDKLIVPLSVEKVELVYYLFLNNC